MTYFVDSFLGTENYHAPQNQANTAESSKKVRQLDVGIIATKELSLA